MSIVFSFFSNLILLFGQGYAWFSILRQKINFKDKYMYIKFLFFNMAILLSYYFANNYLRGPIDMIITILFCKIITKQDLRKSIILAFISQITIIISEAVLIAITVFILHLNIELISSNEIISIVFDILIALLICVSSKLKILKKLYNWLIKITNYIKMYQLLIFILFIVLAIWIFCATIAFKNNIFLVAILNIIISIIYTVIILFIFKYQSKLHDMTTKYDMILDSLQSQEHLINDYRIANHENNNNLQTIKQMTKNKKVTGFIDSLINEQKYLNKDIIKESLKFPSIGIRALMYNKMLEMKDNNIKYFIEFDKKLSAKKFMSLDNDDIVDICQLLGVFIDNAIEETMNYKDQSISISFCNIDDNIKISISNYFEILNYNNKHFKFKSKKGQDRGYGLKLVKRIVDNNNKIQHSMIITKNVFTQIIIIKNK